MKVWSVALVCIVSVLVVGGLEAYALYLGYDGLILSGVVAALVSVPAVLITKKVVKKD